jgi:hypothetical protein
LFGLNVFQVRAEEELNASIERQKWWLSRALRPHDPTCTARQIWDAVSIVAILLSVFSAMLEFAFPVVVTGDEGLLDIIFSSYGILSIFFWIDMVYNFLTAIYTDEGELEFRHGPIALNYFKTFFFIDLLSNAPIEGGPWGLLKVVRLQRMSRVLTRWGYLGYDVMKIQSFKLVILVLGMGHLIACVFFMVSKYGFDAMEKEIMHGLGGPSPTEIDDDLNAVSPRLRNDVDVRRSTI